ncbi:MAG: antitoxin CcdA [Phenylobacterium sp.]|jgi:antitoxin CcdA
MIQTYDNTAHKKPTNLSINSDLLAKARHLKINLSATLEAALTLEVRKAAREQWQQDNKDGIDAANKLVEKHGLFSDSYRNL